MQLESERMQFYIGDSSTLESIRQLPVDEPFSAPRIEFLNDISRALLSDQEAKAYPDVVTFAFWIRRANMEKQKELFLSKTSFRLGRGTVFHIAPSNVAVNYAYSFAAGFVLGNANIVRLPSRDFPQIEIINRAVKRVLAQNWQKWGEYIIFLRYTRDQQINDYLSSLCDVRVVWGGDATIHEIRKSELPPRAGEITFADRYSICVIDIQKYLETDDKEQMALRFYNDTYLADQNACTSPILICWLGDNCKLAEAQEIFWNTLWPVVSQKYKAQPIQFVEKLVNCCSSSVHIPGCHVVKMRDNLITRVGLEQLPPDIQLYRGTSGFFFEYHLRNVMDLRPICGDKLQTVAYCGNPEMLLPLVCSGIKGIDRIVPIGNAMNFGLIWDGHNLVERMTREVYSD